MDPDADIPKASFIVHFLTLSSLLNTVYTFWRKRHYRLFENPLDAPPITPSAHRVRVDSSPMSSSPLRFLSNILAGESAESRSHPDATRDVWELAVWDPSPFSLRMFCFFSPGHILVYWLLLPTSFQDSRSGVTVITTILLTSLLSTQLILLQSFFEQLSKDTSVIHKEVFNEYDTKYVHPRTQPEVRDVGTQFSLSGDRSIDTYPETVIINKGFHPKPNPNYIKYVDPERHSTPPRITLANKAPLLETPAHLHDKSSPLHRNTNIPQGNLVGRRVGDGGNLGIYSHAHSPLRKAASANFSEIRQRDGSRTSPVKRDGSPLKRVSMANASTKPRWDQI